jgi:hypothetical protein
MVEVVSLTFVAIKFNSKKGVGLRGNGRRVRAFFKEFSLGGQNMKKRQNKKYEPSSFG